jgi:hypothetical protein
MTMKLSRTVVAATLLGLSFQASAEIYEFDTLTEFQSGFPNSITGILRNTTTPFTTSFSINTDFAQVGCIPVFLTMLEKPGRYFLTVDIANPGPQGGLIACKLTLRN